VLLLIQTRNYLSFDGLWIAYVCVNISQYSTSYRYPNMM